MKKTMAVVVMVALCAQARAADDGHGAKPNLAAPQPVQREPAAARPAPQAASNFLPATAAGVIIGAGLMLAGTWAKTPKAARGWSRGGLAVMVVLPLSGAVADMESSSSWEAVPAR